MVGRMRVLAFEDCVDIEALLLAGGIEMNSIEFKQYWDSANYLERIEHFEPEILLLDHYMAPTKGLELLKNLRNSSIKQPIVVAMSSASIANNAMLNHGANYGIVKFDLANLDLWPHSS
jgi:FixJ family two-component response regulator